MNWYATSSSQGTVEIQSAFYFLNPITLRRRYEIDPRKVVEVMYVWVGRDRWSITACNFGRKGALDRNLPQQEDRVSCIQPGGLLQWCEPPSNDQHKRIPRFVKAVWPFIVVGSATGDWIERYRMNGQIGIEKNKSKSREATNRDTKRIEAQAKRLRHTE